MRARNHVPGLLCVQGLSHRHRKDTAHSYHSLSTSFAPCRTVSLCFSAMGSTPLSSGIVSPRSDAVSVIRRSMRSMIWSGLSSGSTTTLPSSSLISTSVPGVIPRRSRTAFGSTIRPFESTLVMFPLIVGEKITVLILTSISRLDLNKETVSPTTVTPSCWTVEQSLQD